MQVSFSPLTIQTPNSSNLLNIMQHLSPNEKTLFKKALLSVPSKDLPKVIKALSQIPPNEHYIKELLNKIDEFKPQKGFSIYA
jgi:hypothetical protein